MHWLAIVLQINVDNLQIIHWHGSSILTGVCLFLIMKIHELSKFFLCKLIYPLRIMLLRPVTLPGLRGTLTEPLLPMHRLIRLPHYIGCQDTRMRAVNEGHGHFFSLQISL